MEEALSALLLFFVFLAFILFIVTLSIRTDIRQFKSNVCEIVSVTPKEYIDCKELPLSDVTAKAYELKLKYDKLVKEANTTNK